MSINTNKDVIARFITEVWNKNNLDVLDELIDSIYYDYSYEPRNREGLERVLQMMQVAFPGHETIIEEIVSEGDTVAICQTLRGVHSGSFRGLSASGKQFEIGGYRFFKIRGGKITSHRGLIDLPGLLQQISAND
ncbi:MAG: ester cyclase [Ktedonobacteraceae bacterium]|nr:ester cyclase [Ktedonobacteraceae bacterium]